MTSEEKGITWEHIKEDSGEVPPPSCSRIDDVLGMLKDVNSLLKDAGHYESAEEFASAVDTALWNADSCMEEIRTINEQLRSQSEYWYDIAKREYFSEVEE